MEDGKAVAAVAAARQWRAAAALTAIACLALLGLQVQPLGFSLRLVAVTNMPGLMWQAAERPGVAAAAATAAASDQPTQAVADGGAASLSGPPVVPPAAGRPSAGQAAAAAAAAAAADGRASAVGNATEGGPVEAAAAAAMAAAAREAAAPPLSSSQAGSPPIAGAAAEAAAGAAADRAAHRAAGRGPALPPCLAGSLLQPGDVSWSALNGSVDQFTIRGCPLRRFSHAEAVQCLAGKRLVFVGDSITRYQYLTLLHFLDRGQWPHPSGNQPGQPSVANEHEWPSWNAFLRGTSRLFGGRELCDCYREDLFQYFDPRFRRFVTWKPPEEEKFENRHYRSGNLSVSHFTFTTEPNTVHGHFGFPPYENGRKPCKPAACKAAADWSYHLADALRKPVAAMQPTYLVLNSGLWGSSSAFGDKAWREIARAGRAAVAAQQGRVIWRTTTASLGKAAVGRDHDTLALQHTTAAGWGVLDAWAITNPLLQLLPGARPMWDPRHFTAVVYRELNQYLLNMICQ